jgi:nucleotide-binding universal stress UspA family protein
MFDKMRILVGIDGSVQSKKALAEAISIASRFSGFVKVVTVYDKGKERKAETTINEAKQELEKEQIKFDTLMVNNSNAAKALLLIAKQEHFDLIVVGSRGLGSRVSMILGSVSKNVAADAYCNVLVVKK